MIVTKLVDFDSYRIITDLGVKMAGQLILFFAAGFIISSAGEVGLLFVVCFSTYVTDFWYGMHAMPTLIICILHRLPYFLQWVLVLR